jgi:hypothetical protein
MSRAALAIVLVLCFSSALLAQDTLPLAKVQRVAVAPVPAVQVRPGSTAPVHMTFRVMPGFHINSNKPSSELLIPTAVKFEVPNDISIGKVEYPAGKEYSFSFSPDEKLVVYSGAFTVKALVIATREAPRGRFRVRGALRYQACDNRACYPPSTVPVEFNVSVGKPAPKKVSRNPGQSPHIHR